jgi:hypothetical protein
MHRTGIRPHSAAALATFAQLSDTTAPMQILCGAHKSETRLIPATMFFVHSVPSSKVPSWMAATQERLVTRRVEHHTQVPMYDRPTIYGEVAA